MGMGLRGRARTAGISALPAALTLALAVSLVVVWGVGAGDVFRYLAYLTSAVAVPGWLVWRAFGPRLRYGADEVATGAALGYVLETAGRVVASSVGLPAATGSALPVMVALLAVMRPATRRRLRATRPRLPQQVAWVYAGVVSAMLIWFALAYYVRQPLQWEGLGGPENDLLFALALAGEAAHRWPLEFPWVAGEPLVYHWFFAEHLGAAHALTGVDLPVLLLRLDLVTTVVLVALTTGAIANCLTKHRWVGPLAAALLLIVQDLAPVSWDRLTSDQRASAAGVPYDTSLWWSTSGGYAAIVFAPLAVMLVVGLRGRLSRSGWVLMSMALVAGAGSKASILPVVLAGTLLVALCQWRRGTRSHVGYALGAAGLTVGAFAASWVVLYRGQSQGLELFPIRFVMTTPLGSSVLGPEVPGSSVMVGLGVLALCLLASTPSWAGLALLGLHGDLRRDPAAQFAWGAALLGLAGVALLYHPGQSNLYFLRTALPVMCAAAAWGMCAAFRTSSGTGVGAWRFLLSVCLAGSATTVALSQIDWLHFPPSSRAGERLATAAVPFFCVAMGSFLAGLLSRLLVRSVRRTREARTAVAALACALFLAGAGSVQVIAQVVRGSIQTSPGTVVPDSNPGQQIHGDNVKAAQWVRDHALPDDVILTNVLCANEPSGTRQGCDNRTFWVAAYSERRTYLSGWGYTATANRLAAEEGVVNAWEAPFWNQEEVVRIRGFLASPTPGGARAFAHQGVRWILVAPGFDEASPALSEVADLEHRVNGTLVYRLHAE
jgi:hypothetical protein